MGRTRQDSRRSRKSTRRSRIIRLAVVTALCAGVVLVATSRSGHDAEAAVRTAPATAAGAIERLTLPPIGAGLGGPPSTELTPDQMAEIRSNLRESLGTINFVRNDGQWEPLK
jgi:hypothetical protein